MDFGSNKNQILSSLLNKGVLSANNPGSVAEIQASAMALQVSRLEQLIELASRQSKLGTAIGRGLDAWGEELMLPRLRERKASSLWEERNVYFFRRDGEPIGSEVGNRLRGSRILDRSRNKEYLVTEVNPNAIFTVDNRVYVSVETLQMGEEGNVGPNDLILSSLELREIGVSNNYPIVNGANEEPDERYRARLLNRWRSFRGSTEANISQIAGVFSQVGKYNIIHNQRGICKSLIVVQPVLGTSLDPSTLTQIQRLVLQSMPAGHLVEVRNAIQNQLTIESNIYTRLPLTITEKQILVESIKRIILNSISQVSIGEAISLDTLHETILNSDSRIIGLGSNRSRFDTIGIRTREGSFSYSEQVTGDSYVPREDEIVTIDSSDILLSVI